MISLLLELFGILPRLVDSTHNVPTTLITPTAIPSPTPVPVACGGATSDAFYGSLNTRWQWIHPSSSATESIGPQGSLSLSATPGSDIDPVRHNFNAPRLLQPISGNFIVTTLLSFSASMKYQSAGILLWQDDPMKFLRLELAHGDNESRGINFQAASAPNTMGQHPTSTTTVELRIQRQGDNFTAWWSVPGDQGWQSAGQATLHFDTLQVGLYVVADFGTSLPPLTTASFDYFMVSCQSSS